MNHQTNGEYYLFSLVLINVRKVVIGAAQLVTELLSPSSGRTSPLQGASSFTFPDYSLNRIIQLLSCSPSLQRKTSHGALHSQINIWTSAVPKRQCERKRKEVHSLDGSQMSSTVTAKDMRFLFTVNVLIKPSAPMHLLLCPQQTKQTFTELVLQDKLCQFSHYCLCSRKSPFFSNQSSLKKEGLDPISSATDPSWCGLKHTQNWSQDYFRHVLHYEENASRTC